MRFLERMHDVLDGKQAQVPIEMMENRVYVQGISACRWTDFGKSVTSTDEVIVYSGRKDN